MDYSQWNRAETTANNTQVTGTFSGYLASVIN